MNFHHPSCIWCPRLVDPIEILARSQKIKGTVISYDDACVILRLDILVELRLVTDRWTNRQTQSQSTYDSSIALRGKNCSYGRDNA